MRTSSSFAGVVVSAWLALAGGDVALADPGAATVVAIDGRDVYVDLGARDGVGAGATLELLHEVVARDPRTHATLRDHFALGTLAVVKAGDAICVARADAELARRVLVGDRVRRVSPAHVYADPWAEQVARSTAAGGPPVDPSAPEPDHGALAEAAWRDTLGLAPEARIARWQALLAADPRTPYAAAIGAEIASLHGQRRDRDAAIAKAQSTRDDDRDPRIARLAAELGVARWSLVGAAIARAAPGAPLELAFVASQPIARGWLYARSRGEAGYHRVELRRDGDAYLRATIDAALVRAPAVEWYVEAAAPGARGATPVLGSQAAPNAIAVERPVVEAPIAAGRSHVDLSLEYVDFDGKRSAGFDHYTQAEADFGYRFLAPIYQVRLGFGTLSGIGGPKAVIDAAPTTCIDGAGVDRCRRVDFTYVYSELELRVRPNVALLVRPQAGLVATDTRANTDNGRCRGSDLDGCQFATGIGGRVRLRLGDEVGTNLVIGAAFTRGVGTMLEAAYHWRPAPVVPVQISVQVTDQPVPEDAGVRLIGDVGLRELAWVYPSLRLSYQARDLKHTGVSGGLALNFDW